MMYKKKYIINFKVNEKYELELPEEFNSIIFELIRYSRKRSFNSNLKQCYEYELVFVDEHNIIENRLNFLVEWYIKECLKDLRERNFAVTFNSEFYKNPELFFESLRNFINYSYKAILIEDCKIYSTYPEDQDLFDVILSENYFKVFIPKDLVSEHKYNSFMLLGKDYLLGSFEPFIIEKYILPHYLMYAFLNDKLDDQTFDLKKAEIGLH